ncbi:MAG TPA: HAD-IIIA family hydrolase [Thermoguttaceae bacterium]|nr:HAD-IIIA family hydrolase [Thermoguttaceae bacterium]
MDLNQQCQPIELILSDVDGVLTDGRLTLDDHGVESKHFSARDGMGIRLWQNAGYRFGMITARRSEVVRLRAKELDIEILHQGATDKLAAMRQILDELHLAPEQVCYIGDDWPDLSVVRAAGLGVAVADACEELREAADFVTRAIGGAGAVRELIEWVLENQGRWEEVTRAYA